MKLNKGGKPYMIPLNPVTHEVLSKLLAKIDGSSYLFYNERTGKPIQNTKTAFTGGCGTAGIKGLTFHDLLHSFATRLKEMCVDPITRRVVWVIPLRR
jgi:integrase